MKKLLIFVFGKNHSAGYLWNLLDIHRKLVSMDIKFQTVIVNSDLDFLSFNKAFKMDTDVPFDGNVDYDYILVTSDGVLPSAESFDRIVKVSESYDVFTMNNFVDAEGIPERKLSDEPPLSCFFMKHGVLESIESYPWIQPSITSFTDGFMGSINKDVIIIPDVEMVKW